MKRRLGRRRDGGYAGVLVQPVTSKGLSMTSPLRTVPSSRDHPDPAWQARVDLAAAFRWTARFGWHEAVANHFSAAVSEDGRRFLINPRWRHFSRIRASDLLLLDADDPSTRERPDAPDPTAWCIHGAIHRALPHARCILHTHMPYATTLTALQDMEIKPIDQNSLRFFNRVAYDDAYEGLALSDEEGARMANALGDKRIMLMANHGVLVTGESIAQAFDDLYYLERACQVQVLARQAGTALRPVPGQIAERAAREWEAYDGFAAAHFAELKAILDAEEPDYAD
jgi:ribulose-5-phosphate 4-epimerase/fuculose-1-phosphate aldolase